MPKKVVIAKHPAKAVFVDAQTVPVKKAIVKAKPKKVPAKIVPIVIPPVVIPVHIQPIVLPIVPAGISKSFTTRDVSKAGVRIR